MELLNPTVANFLQFLTMPLEAIGLSMAFLEFRMPRLARKANKAYLRLLAWNEESFPFSPRVIVDSWRQGFPVQAVSTSGGKRPDRLGVVYTRVLLVALYLIFLGAAAGFAAERFQDSGLAGLPLTLLSIVAASALMVAPHYLILAAGRFIPGRPLGGFGILMGGIGVVGEMYQLAVIVQESVYRLWVYSLLALVVIVIVSSLSSLYRFAVKT